MSAYEYAENNYEFSESVKKRSDRQFSYLIKYIDKNDRVCMPIFSDAASAIFIDKNSAPTMLSSIFLTDGSGAKYLCLKNKNDKSSLFMHGANVFTFTATKVPYATNYLLEKANLKISDIKFFFYQRC